MVMRDGFFPHQMTHLFTGNQSAILLTYTLALQFRQLYLCVSHVLLQNVPERRFFLHNYCGQCFIYE